MPKFLVDECSGKTLCFEIQKMGFDAMYVGDMMKGSRDIDVIKFAENEKRIIITNDTDFGKLVFRKKIKSRGIILLRLQKDIPSERIKYLKFVLENFLEKIGEKFVVVSEDKIRIRKI